MIVDITGTILTPGNGGNDCLGNGEFTDTNGEPIECCCDGCDYYLCCVREGANDCLRCHDQHCPRKHDLLMWFPPSLRSMTHGLHRFCNDAALTADL